MNKWGKCSNCGSYLCSDYACDREDEDVVCVEDHDFVGSLDDDCESCGCTIYMTWHTDSVSRNLREFRREHGMPIIGY